jgi:MFS family permease
VAEGVRAAERRWRVPALGRSFSSLQTRNYRLYFTGQVVSQSGTWMQRMAQAWLVLDLTGSPLALGTVTAIQYVPILVLTLLGGVLADRFPKRGFLLLLEVLRLLQALTLGLLVVSGHIVLWQVYALALVHGLIAAVEQPTRRAFPSELVPRKQLTSAVALNSAINNAARIIGPALGGVTLAAVGVGGCFLANAVSYFAVLAALWLMRPADFYGSGARSRGSVLDQLRESLSYAYRTPEIAFTLLLVGVLGTFGYNFTVFLALLARYSLDAGALGFGALNSALGVGAVLGAVVVAAQHDTSRRSIVLGAGAFTLGLGLLALSPTYWLTLVLLFGQGIASVAFSAGANTRIQMLVPEALRGRVLALYGLLFVGATPIGAALTGAIADRWDVRAALAVDAAACLIGVLAGVAYLRVVARRGEPAAPLGTA